VCLCIHWMVQNKKITSFPNHATSVYTIFSCPIVGSDESCDRPIKLVLVDVLSLIICSDGNLI